jgi:hypothetical protein
MTTRSRLLTTAVSLILATSVSQTALADGPKPMPVPDGKGSCPTIFGGGSSEWYVCDNVITDNGLPVGGSCDSGAAGSGAGFGDAELPAGSDAFDLGSMLWINNVQLGGALTVAGQTANFAAQNISGLTASLRYDVLTTESTARVLLTLSNNDNPTGGVRGGTISVPVDYVTNFGSDGSTQIRGSSSGDTSFTTADRWLVTSDSSDADAVNTTVLWGGTPLVPPQSVSSTVFSCAGTEGASARFQVSVAPGTTVRLMFFQRLSDTAPNALAAAPDFDNVVAGSPLLAGLAPAEFASVVNWTAGPEPVVYQAVPVGQSWALLGLGFALGLFGIVTLARRHG